MSYVARRAIDLVPTLVLSAQLLFGALFGILGLMPAALKVAREHKSKDDEAVPVA